MARTVPRSPFIGNNAEDSFRFASFLKRSLKWRIPAPRQPTFALTASLQVAKEDFMPPSVSGNRWRFLI